MVTAMLMVVSCSMFAADAEPVIPRFNDGRDWFFEKRFGLFVHWGLYAIPAWHEQHPYRLRVPREEYEKLIHQFNPVKFNPDAWLDLAEKAGMNYLCITTKHIEGFCLWNTAQTSYNVMNAPYGKDILAQLAEACHRRNFPLCLYYSVVDMHHPNYPNEGRSYEYEKPAPGDQPDLQKYLAFLRAQVTELCTNYGAIHGFWWDGNVVKYQDPSYNALIRSLQPQAVINNRGFDAGDFSTPERDWNDEVNQQLAFTKPTEACQAVGRQSWGYRKEEDYYSDEHLLRSIDKILAKGGNYLLNVGPMADGTMPPEGVRILEKIGVWYNAVKESFDGIPASQLVENREILVTRKGNTLYVHLNQPPQTRAVYMHPFNVKPRIAVLLNDGRNVETRVDLLPWDHETGKPVLRLYNLPVNDFSDTVMVVKLEFDDPVPWAGK